MFCQNFFTFCRDFHQFKTFGGADAPPLLHQWTQPLDVYVVVFRTSVNRGTLNCLFNLFRLRAVTNQGTGSHRTMQVFSYVQLFSEIHAKMWLTPPLIIMREMKKSTNTLSFPFLWSEWFC